MRLLNVDTFDLVEFHNNNRPPYVAASHRWQNGKEATFQDLRDRRNTNSEGYQKVEAFATFVRDTFPAVGWLWIDTCCINKDSAAELSEAINSMFEWYQNAELCLAYLADVEKGHGMSSFERSEWFERGWTLQELLAPQLVLFVTKSWQVIGHKGGFAGGGHRYFIGGNLGEIIARITGIPAQVLRDYDASYALNVDEKLRWMENRTTTREEDMSYALYGILNVTIGANYGEKFDGARRRLLVAVHQQDDMVLQQAEYYRKICDWLSPSDPWTSHGLARERHEPQTGSWLLQHHRYVAWKSGSTRCLWLHGNPGCGKTILCSTVIEDIRMYCQDAASAAHVIFYFSFSDDKKQTYGDLILSLVVQLGWKEPGLSMLRQAYRRPDRRRLGVEDLEKIFLSSTVQYNEVFLQLDALDECPDTEGVRRRFLSGIAQLLDRANNVRMLATSRDVQDVRHFMQNISADSIPLGTHEVKTDLQKYISTQISSTPKLARLDRTTKMFVEETLLQKADGMFRWVYCQLQELSQSKSTKPKLIKKMLLGLPKDLYETYERMLGKILEHDRPYALTLLRWLAYAQSPVSLDELAEASIIDPTDDPNAHGSVDFEDRGCWEDILEILAGFVILERVDRDDMDNDATNFQAADSNRSNIGRTKSCRVGKHARIKLAHFSVKEYLESQRLLASEAKGFHFDPAKEHSYLMQSCIVYLAHYGDSPEKTSTAQDLAAFPLLEYAAKNWYRHASLQRSSCGTRELSLLTSKSRKRDWLLVHDPDRSCNSPFQVVQGVLGGALYYASLLGLETAVQHLLSEGADVNARGGQRESALQAASEEGHEGVVQRLIDAGADVDIQGGFFGCPLQAASYGNYENVVQMLINAGADVNAQGGYCGTPLQAASFEGRRKIVQILVDMGADINAQAGEYGNALQAASFGGHKDIVQILLGEGADVNAEGGECGTALQAASYGRHMEVVQILMEAGAGLEVEEGAYDIALAMSSDDEGQSSSSELF